MPPHTISPTSTSQGLGISLSTLSPPVTQSGRQGHHQPVSFTGMGLMPRSDSQPQMPSLQPDRPKQSRRHYAPPSTNTNGVPLYQPGQASFALKPTHTRGGSKGFNTFSALPPRESPSKPPPVVTPDRTPQAGRTPRGFLPKLDTSPDSSVESSAFGCDQDDDDAPLRQSSGSRHPSSRQPRRNKSVDFLRSLSSRNGAEQTLGGGAYVPLSGTDQQSPGREELSVELEQADKTGNRLSSTSSTGATGAVTHNNASVCGPPPSDALHTAFFPQAHPYPSDRQQGVPDASRHVPAPSGPGVSRGMSRSRSTPHDLQGAVGSSSKRLSDPSTGTHSKNRVLREAENGGMMLAFSPGGDYRPGREIVGPGSDLCQTPVAPPALRAHSAEELHEESLRSRPWSNSTMSDHMRPPTFGSRGRSMSEGAGLLARQGTLFHPDSSKQRSSAELSLMLGQPRSRRLSGNRVLPPPDLEAWRSVGGGTDEVRLEAAKKKKARVEIDVILERECVVEGGEVRGRLEITVNGGKRGEGLRVAGGKARVVGFEDISADSRHIFYHRPHCLPVFDPKGDPSLPIPSLFASGPDEEGYRLAAEGTHSMSFRMRLPLGGGAKGSFSSPNGKGPCVRYVVVGSVKLLIPSTGKRSIAHFYRPIVILPYLNPSIVLAPTPEPIENTVERGLGWSLGGEKGKVEMRISLGRRNWVAGQRAWCEVGIKNNSSRKIKNITLALLQTVQTFHPDSDLNTGNIAARLRRRSVGPSQDPGTPEMDACQTSTVRRKLAEEVMEADTNGHGEGRVTGKAWWTGVEAGERDHWDMSLLIPNGLISIRRTRLIEVTYLLRVTVNGSIYVDVPISLINFLSIDPPPMPGDYARTPVPRPVTTQLQVDHPQQRPQPARMTSENSLSSAVNPARASSTTLHVDALLQAGRARADAKSDAQRQGTEDAQADRRRPLSVGSEYTLPHAKSLADLLALDPPPLPEMESDQQRRPPAHTMKSFLSERSDHTLDPSMYDHEAEQAGDQSITDARRKVGRQKSLVLAINRAEQRALEAMEELEMDDHHSTEGYHALSPGKDSVQMSEFLPDGTPFEHAVYELGEMPPVPEIPDRDGGYGKLRVRNLTPEPEQIAGNDSLDAGDETVLLDLVKDHLPQIRASSPLDLGGSSGRGQVEGVDDYDYAPEHSDFNPASPLTGQQDDSLRARYADLDPYAGLDPQQQADRTRERYNSYAPSEQESEVGQVENVVKRNLSVRLPARLVPAGSTNEQGSQQAQEDNVASSSGHKNTHHRLLSDRGDSLSRSPRGSAPPLHPSPLRQVQQLPSEGEAAGVRKVSRPLPRFPQQAMARPEPSQKSGDVSPKSHPEPYILSHHAGASGSIQQRSQLRHQISMDSKYGSTEDEAPGLAPSVASDSASSDGHLESPPNSAVPLSAGILPDVLPKSHVGAFADGSGWIPGPTDADHDVFSQTHASSSQLTLGPSVQVQDTLSSDSHSMPGSPQTAESMLPSVRTKIDQLNNRDEALRKFSVSGAISPSTPRASISSNPRGSIYVQPRQSIISPSIPMVTSPISTAGRSTPQAASPKSPSSIISRMQATTPTKRRSYTAALGPRHARVASDDSTESTSGMLRSPSTHRIGNTTYLTKRSFAQARHISPPKGLAGSPSIYTQSSGLISPTGSHNSQDQRSPSKLDRNMSISSTSTSATTIEAALMRRPGGPRQPSSPGKLVDSRMMGPRQVARPLAQYGRVSEEEDSDGLI